MSKARGINTRILINASDLSNYFKTFDADATVNPLDVTAFLDTAKAWLSDGYKEGKISLEGFYAKDMVTADQVDDILRAALGVETKQVLTIAPVNSQTLGNFCFLASADLESLKVSSPATGVIMSNAAFVLSSGLEFGVILQILGALTATGNGTGVDNGAASLNGGAGHLHVLAASGTTPTLDGKIQHSTDNSLWVDLISFAQKTAAGSERVETTGLAAVSQIETATVAGGATASANIIVTVTAAGLTGSPLATNVAVLNGDTAAQVAGKIRTALGLVSAITSLYTVGGSSATVTLTKTSPVANDATLNIAIDGTTNSTGVPDAATSANTTAGVAAGGVHRYTRFIRTIGGTGPSFTVAVSFARHNA